jgi:hypothetical protein
MIHKTFLAPGKYPNYLMRNFRGEKRLTANLTDKTHGKRARVCMIAYFVFCLSGYGFISGLYLYFLFTFWGL